MKKFIVSCFTVLCFITVNAQEIEEMLPDTGATSQQVLLEDVLPDATVGEILQDTIPETDGYYQVNNLKDAVPFAYPKVNPKNIRFYKRIWRDIDLKEEENYIFATPGASLIEAIMAGIKAGKLTPYNPEDDGFKTRLTAREGEARFTDSVLVPIFDDEGNQIDAQMALNEFNPEKVTKFRIKEDMFFDKQRGKLETRIIGVAPLMEINSSEELAESVGATPAFWLYFPQLRYTLVQIDVSDPDRELYDMSMDDLFVQRKFASRIIRESSPGGIGGQYANAGEEQQELDGKEVEDKINQYQERLWRNPRGIKSEELLSPEDQYQKKEGTDKPTTVIASEKDKDKDKREVQQ